MSNTENGNFKSNLESLFKGMDSFISTNTVVGEPIHIDDTIILPLVDVMFGVGAGAFDGKDNESSGGGGLGARLQAGALLVIQDGSAKLINVKNSGTLDRVIDLVPDVINKIKGSGKNRSQDSDNKMENGEDRKED